HIPNDYLPDLRVGAAAEVVMPFERLFGGGLEGSRVHLEAELATHLFKVTDSIALEPEFAFKITDFTHASEAERDTGLAFAATLGLQAHFGRDAEVTLRHGTQTAYTSSASVAASPETEGTLELKGEPTARTAS